MIQKHERLESIKSPKIILAAGSNMAFGIDSEKIEKEFSIPVVNLSIHAGLGTSFILEELKNSIAPNDIVFLSLEYFLGDGGDRLKKSASDVFSPATQYYTMDTYSMLCLSMDDTKINIKNKVRQLINPRVSSIDVIYSKDAFNKYGDVVSHLNKKNKRPLSGKGIKKYVYWDKIKEINKFYDYAVEMNVDVFYLYPTYPESQYKINEKVINLLRNDLNNDLKIEILNEPSSLVFHDSLFFDTVYHLNKNGREKRTTKMIEIVKKNKKAQQRLKRQ